MMRFSVERGVTSSVPQKRVNLLKNLETDRQTHVNRGISYRTRGEMRCFERTLLMIEVSISPAQSITVISARGVSSRSR